MGSLPVLHGHITCLSNHIVECNGGYMSTNIILSILCLIPTKDRSLYLVAVSCLTVMYGIISDRTGTYK